MSSLTVAAFRQLQEFRSRHGIASPPASLSPPPPPERPLTPRDNRRAQREGLVNERVKTTAEWFLGERERKVSPLGCDIVVRAVLAQGFRPGEISEIGEAVEAVLQSRPDLLEPLPVQKVDERTYAEAQAARLDFDPEKQKEYRETMQRAGIEVGPYRPLPRAGVGTFKPPPPPEPEPYDAATQEYLAARQRAGLPPLSRSQLLAYRGAR